jgi:hypothetical protein
MEIGATIVYVLCALTCLGCTILLINRYRRSRIQLLFWSAAGFLAFSATNILLFLDRAILPEVDLYALRTLITLIGSLVMVYGLVTESTK